MRDNGRMDLVEFLWARLDDDESLARTVGRVTWPHGTMRPDEEDFLNRFHDERVLAEVEAKRQIIDLCATETPETGGLPLALRTLRLLAMPYAEHPDYDEAWRPQSTNAV